MRRQAHSLLEIAEACSHDEGNPLRRGIQIEELRCENAAKSHASDYALMLKTARL